MVIHDQSDGRVIAAVECKRASQVSLAEADKLAVAKAKWLAGLTSSNSIRPEGPARQLMAAVLLYFQSSDRVRGSTVPLDDARHLGHIRLNHISSESSGKTATRTDAKQPLLLTFVNNTDDRGCVHMRGCHTGHHPEVSSRF